MGCGVWLDYLGSDPNVYKNQTCVTHWEAIVAKFARQCLWSPTALMLFQDLGGIWRQTLESSHQVLLFGVADTADCVARSWIERLNNVPQAQFEQVPTCFSVFADLIF